MSKLRAILPLILMVGAMVVASPRYVGLFANQEGARLDTPFFVTAVYFSGLGMAILEGIAIWYMFTCWSTTEKRNTERKMLLVLICTTFVDLAVMATPYIDAASRKMLVSEVLPEGWLWLWSLATAIAAPLIMGAVGLAESLVKEVETEKVPAAAVVTVPVTTTAIVPTPTPVVEVRKLSVEELIFAGPHRTDQSIAEQAGVSRQRVGQIRKRLEEQKRLTPKAQEA
jgi:hypothetical protein